MSVIQHKLHSAGASGSASGGVDSITTNISYQSHYRVQVSDPLDTPHTVLEYFRGNSELPWPGRPFKFGNGFDVQAYCKTVDPSYVEFSVGWYNVQCTFASVKGEDSDQSGNGPDGKKTKDPLKWHDDIDVSFTQISVPVERGTFRQFNPPGPQHEYLTPGKECAIINSAMERFDPAVEEELEIKVIRIARYIKEWSGADSRKFHGVLNSDYVTILKPAYKFKDSFSPYQGRLRVGAAFQIVNGIPCYKQTAEVHINPLPFGWRRQLLDQGIHALVNPGAPDGHGGSFSDGDGNPATTPGVPSLRALTDEEGIPISTPVPLDGQGQPLKAGKENVFMIYSTRKEVAFAGFQW